MEDLKIHISVWFGKPLDRAIFLVENVREKLGLHVTNRTAEANGKGMFGGPTNLTVLDYVTVPDKWLK